MNQSKIQLEFGVSSGDAFQVEGWPRFSDWYDWTHQTDKIKDYSNANEATQFWQRYRDDIELAKKVGAKVFKISMAWDRIESSPGEWDWAAFDTYRKMIDGIHECGMSAVVCLQSYVLPRWLAKLGGTCSEDFPSCTKTQ